MVKYIVFKCFFSSSQIIEFTQKKTGQMENERRERKNINKEKKC